MLTAKQQAVLRFLEECVAGTGVFPSTREIQEHFGFASQTAAVNHIRALERKGFIERTPRKARAVTLKTRASLMRMADIQEIPLHGTIPAGAPFDIEQIPEGQIRIGTDLLGTSKPAGRLFALTVTGDSMSGAHIIEGDTVVLENRRPKEGEIVAALIDGETTLKRFVKERGKPVLVAENRRYRKRTPMRNLEIQGVVVGVVRKVLGR